MPDLKKIYIQRKSLQKKDFDDTLFLLTYKHTLKQYKELASIQKYCSPQYSLNPKIAIGGHLTYYKIKNPYKFNSKIFLTNQHNAIVLYKKRWYCGPTLKVLTFSQTKRTLFFLFVCKQNVLSSK